MRTYSPQQWRLIERCYDVEGESQRKLARRFNVPVGTIAARCARKGWEHETARLRRLLDQL